MGGAGIHFNQSSLKAAFNETTRKIIVSSYEYGEDCEAFLDPSIETWSDAKNYQPNDIMKWTSTFIYSGDRPRECFRCKIANINKPPRWFPDYWTKISDAAPIDALTYGNWQLGGYGGFGRTPKYLTLQFQNNQGARKIISCGEGDEYWEIDNHSANVPPYPSINGRFVLTQGFDPFLDHLEADGSSYKYRPANIWGCRTNYSNFGFWWCRVELGELPNITLGFSRLMPWQNGKRYYASSYGNPVNTSQAVMPFPIRTYSASYIANYFCKVEHIASPITQPPIGSQWRNYWYDPYEYLNGTLRTYYGEAGAVVFHWGGGWHNTFGSGNCPKDSYIYWRSSGSNPTSRWFYNPKDCECGNVFSISMCGNEDDFEVSEPEQMKNGCDLGKLIHNAVDRAEAYIQGGQCVLTAGAVRPYVPEWGLAKQYVVGDFVTYRGIYYYCVHDHLSWPYNAPDQPWIAFQYWQEYTGC